ncbi:transglutaminase-like cysteine peptidase [Pseudomonas sp. P66]|uniref:Transglutaminase-like cysteine peptidase n=1 Tax=Pseudomonas arcuscaelestis TaxID=2710591 RepID=A0ABS2C4L1_9PSED|nr:transglutaminase-like cysteine peptidase [Pseudomonas arcuscaelestis]MBM5460813.1 transglutaminase-like cysteine peptidase [Pseudomonas arcuscaelestis]
MVNFNFKAFTKIIRQLNILAAVLLGLGVLSGSAIAVPLPQSLHLTQQATQRLDDWRALVADSGTLSEQQKLLRVNEFFNKNIRFGEDSDVWKKADYWASPLETLEKGAGDCEDFALAKYYTLRLLGVPESNVRLLYTTVNASGQAHMVLSYWQTSQSDPLLLDNLTNNITSAIQRNDLKVEFAFNNVGLYQVDQAGVKRVGNIEQLPNWSSFVSKTQGQASLLMAGTQNTDFQTPRVF